jgi:hypothetical protein
MAYHNLYLKNLSQQIGEDIINKSKKKEGNNVNKARSYRNLMSTNENMSNLASINSRNVNKSTRFEHNHSKVNDLIKSIEIMKSGFLKKTNSL